VSNWGASLQWVLDFLRGKKPTFKILSVGVSSRDSDVSVRPNPWAYVPREASHYLAMFAARVATGALDSVWA
jgi:hypothetical protein